MLVLDTSTYDERNTNMYLAFVQIKKNLLLYKLSFLD